MQHASLPFMGHGIARWGWELSRKMQNVASPIIILQLHTQQRGQRALRALLKKPCGARLGGSLERGQSDKTTGIMVMLGNSNIQLVAPATRESWRRKNGMKQGSHKVHLNSRTASTTARRFHHTSLPLKRNGYEKSSSFLPAKSWSRKQGRVEMQATKNINWANRAGRAWEREASIWVPAGSSWDTHGLGCGWCKTCWKKKQLPGLWPIMHGRL